MAAARRQVGRRAAVAAATEQRETQTASCWRRVARALTPP